MALNLNSIIGVVSCVKFKEVLSGPHLSSSFAKVCFCTPLLSLCQFETQCLPDACSFKVVACVIFIQVDMPLINWWRQVLNIDTLVWIGSNFCEHRNSSFLTMNGGIHDNLCLLLSWQNVVPKSHEMLMWFVSLKA